MENRTVGFGKRGTQLDGDVQIPCGKCVGCRMDKRRNWAVRMVHETITEGRNAFITLTYSPEHYPADGKLDKRHVQLFNKSIRKHLPQRIKYFVTGEYGSESGRAHYHAIIFGEDFRGGSYAIDDQLYGNPVLDEIWGRGICSIGSVTPSSAMYVAGYVQKKATDADTFNVMSKGSVRNPELRGSPIGYEFCKRNLHTLAKTGYTTIEGAIHPIPKEYFDWFPEELKSVKNRRMDHVIKRSLEELHHKDINQKAKLKSKKESI